MKKYLHDLAYGLLCMLIVLAVVFLAVQEISPSDKVPAHTGGYYSDEYVSF